MSRIAIKFKVKWEHSSGLVLRQTICRGVLNSTAFDFTFLNEDITVVALIEWIKCCMRCINLLMLLRTNKSNVNVCQRQQFNHCLFHSIAEPNAPGISRFLQYFCFHSVIACLLKYYVNPINFIQTSLSCLTCLCHIPLAHIHDKLISISCSSSEFGRIDTS